MTETRSPPSGKQAALLLVRLGKELHAFPVEAVEEVLPALPVKPIALSPKFVRGVVFVRGHLIPVVDAAERLGLTDYVRPAEPHIVCLRVHGRLVGVEVDEAIDLMVPPDGSRLSPADVGITDGIWASVLERDGEVIRVFDPSRLVAGIAEPVADPQVRRRQTAEP
jgi:purine-binding chemotaxis protein CheW